ncbi:MAG: HNH endonuclease [Gemmatimonadaceae bacterium]
MHRSLSLNHLTKHESPYRDPDEKPVRAHHSAKSERSRPARKRRRDGHPTHKSRSAAKARHPKKARKPRKAHATLTSHPTTRNAFVATREWLLERHGPVCAYCGTRHHASHMTLDHVAPRRGQTAYDRRDNLVLACKSCNQKKRDLAPLAFLLGLRSRASNLLKYGAHLSSGLLELARSLVPDHQQQDDDSPYRD